MHDGRLILISNADNNLLFRFKVDLSVYPLMTAIEERLNQLPAFKAAHPSQQPDCPPDE